MAKKRSNKPQGLTSPENVRPKDVTPDIWELILNRVPKNGNWVESEFHPDELRTLLQWGIDEGKIKPDREVSTHYGLTPRFGPQRLTKDALLALLNVELKKHSIDSPLFLMGAASPSAKYNYSSDWYRR